MWDGDLLFAASPALYLYTLLRGVFLSYFHQLHDLKDVTSSTWWHAAHLRSLDPRLRMHSTHAFAWLASSPHTSLIGDQSQGKATQRRTSPRSLMNLILNLLVSPDHPPIIGEDPRSFTSPSRIRPSYFLATVDVPSLAAGADSANDLCPPSPPVLQFCLKSPKPRGFFPKLHGFPHKSRS